MSRIVHFEIHAENPDRAIAFYSALLDWTFRKWDGPAAYWLIITGPDSERGIDGGLVQRPCPAPQTGSAINAYVCTAEVQDIDACLVRAAQLGAAITMPRMPIPGVGWLAYVRDTEGNTLGLMQPDPKAA